MTLFTISKPAEGEKTAVENTAKPETHGGKKTSLSPLLVIAQVVVSVVIATVVAGVIVYFGLRTCQTDHNGGEGTAPSGTDKDFERHGRFEDHQFSEHCHYDHDINIVVMDLEGDGFGENATVVYDFNRGFLTYVVPALNKCFLGPVNQDDIDSFKNAQDGDILELGAVKPRNFTTTNETIPSVYLAQTTSPLVNDLCSSVESHWIEPAVDEEDTLTREKRQSVTITITRTTYYFSDGTVIRVTEITVAVE